MTSQATLRHTYVEYIPEKLELGVLYISRKYRTALHLCCCGCGLKVVTPLTPGKWKLTDHGPTVSLFPSIGNWSFPCKSHYWVDRGCIQWAREMSEREISNIRRNDVQDTDLHAVRNMKVLSRLGELLKRWFGGN